MIDFFDLLYTHFSQTSNNKIKKFIYSFTRLFIRISSNFIIPLYYSFTSKKKYNLNYFDDNTNLIVSLTSFPARINKISLVIESILRQSIKPKSIYLWLSKSEFNTLDNLPLSLLNQQNRGLVIKLVDENIGSHKKYYFAFKHLSDHLIVTIDDDIFYRTKMIEDLLNYHKIFPNSIISQYSTKIEWDNNVLAEYKFWSRITNETKPNNYSFFGTGGGTLFPPGICFKEFLDYKIFMNLCPTADDVWLNASIRYSNIKVVVTNYFSSFLPVININNTTLDSINNGNNQNDIQIKRTQEYFINKYNKDPFKY